MLTWLHCGLNMDVTAAAMPTKPDTLATLRAAIAAAPLPENICILHQQRQQQRSQSRSHGNAFTWTRAYACTAEPATVSTLGNHMAPAHLTLIKASAVATTQSQQAAAAAAAAAAARIQ
jgi:hypothetical protein